MTSSIAEPFRRRCPHFFPAMDRDQLQGQIRHLLTIIGGALVTRGVLQQGDVEAVVGVGVAVLGLVWSWRHNHPRRRAARRKADSPNAS